MKARLLAIALVAVMVGFGICCGKKKSSEKDITKVVVNGVEYQKSGNSFTYTYPKTAKDVWNPAVPSWPVAPQITFIGKKIEPPVTQPQNFEEGNGVTYTVYAEDGTTATFTVKADRVQTL